MVETATTQLQAKRNEDLPTSQYGKLDRDLHLHASLHPDNHHKSSCIGTQIPQEQMEIPFLT